MQNESHNVQPTKQIFETRAEKSLKNRTIIGYTNVLSTFLVAVQLYQTMRGIGQTVRLGIINRIRDNQTSWGCLETSHGARYFHTFGSTKMNIEIASEPFHVTLFGYSGLIKNGTVPASAKPLMDRMWKEVQDRQIKTQGINHWVYLPDSMVFTGVELKDPTTGVGTLETLEVSLERYVKYLHVGPYSTLGAVWAQLMKELKQRGEKSQYPNLEIYGHWNEDETKCETTILIGLAR